MGAGTLADPERVPSTAAGQPSPHLARGRLYPEPSRKVPVPPRSSRAHPTSRIPATARRPPNGSLGILKSGPLETELGFVLCDTIRPVETVPALDWVISVNLNCRHLTEAQRATIAAKTLPMFEAAAKERMLLGKKTEPNPVADLPQGQGVGKAREHAAKQFNVSPRSVQTAKQIEKQAPDLAEEVTAGRLSLNGAAKKLKEREETRRSARGRDGPSKVTGAGAWGRLPRDP
jgi:hypothetical protein